jgi:hypothetical protein
MEQLAEAWRGFEASKSLLPTGKSQVAKIRGFITFPNYAESQGIDPQTRPDTDADTDGDIDADGDADTHADPLHAEGDSTHGSGSSLRGGLRSEESRDRASSIVEPSRSGRERSGAEAGSTPSIDPDVDPADRRRSGKVESGLDLVDEIIHSADF